MVEGRAALDPHRDNEHDTVPALAANIIVRVLPFLVAAGCPEPNHDLISQHTANVIGDARLVCCLKDISAMMLRMERWGVPKRASNPVQDQH